MNPAVCKHCDVMLLRNQVNPRLVYCKMCMKEYRDEDF